uniref:FBD domain-containing protein n=1 Tax=Brassica oleracea TaxID=3712 RepID=A0A3P6F7I3_BRAOL|nr:unnamed protein product [Brassica oleracea]
MIYSCEYCHSTRQKVFWPQVFCPKDGVIFGLWFQDSNTTISITIFKQFVHRSFLSNKAPVLEHLHLSLGPDCPSVDIGLWINLALSRHVRVLHIVIPYPKKGPVTLPKTGDPPVDVNIVMPSLQRLHMSHANIETRGTYVIDVPSLKCLEISDSARCNFRQIENMPELVRARVSFGADSTHKFLKGLTSVRRLTLRQPLTKPPSSVPECLLHSLEAFEWFEYKGRQVDREMAKYVLKNALRLKTATFSKRSTDMGEKCQMLKELESVATASPSAQILFD